MGKVCRKRQTKQALQDFFTTGNIKQLRCNLHLAEQQGAQISMVYGTAPAVQIAEYARVSGVAKIVMGRINHKSGAHHGENSPADQLTDLEVYILPNCQHLLRGRLGELRVPEAHFSWRDAGVMRASLLLSAGNLMCEAQNRCALSVEKQKAPKSLDFRCFPAVSGAQITGLYGEATGIAFAETLISSNVVRRLPRHVSVAGFRTAVPSAERLPPKS